MQTHSPHKQTNRLPVSLNQLYSSLVRFVRMGCGILLSLQIITSTVLLIIASLRDRKMHERSFPHVSFDEVQMRENRLKLYCYGRDLYDDMLAAIDSAHES